MPTIKPKYVSKEPSVSKYFNVSKTSIVKRLEAFELVSPFTVRSNLDVNPSCNRVPVPGDFYAARMPGNNDDMEYFVFKKEKDGFRSATLKEFLESGALSHLLDDAKNFHNMVLGNDKIVDNVRVVCDDKVATFGGKDALTLSPTSENDRSFQKAYADVIDRKIRKSLESLEKNKKPRVPLRDF